jgi:hypothetical protein
MSSGSPTIFSLLISDSFIYIIKVSVKTGEIQAEGTSGVAGGSVVQTASTVREGDQTVTIVCVPGYTICSQLITDHEGH